MLFFLQVSRNSGSAVLQIMPLNALLPKSFKNKDSYIRTCSIAIVFKVFPLQRRLLLGFKAETLDHSPIGDIKRLARAPFSFHEKTGSLCCPVDSERKPIIPDELDTYNTLDAKLLSPIIKGLKLKEEAVQEFSGFLKNLFQCLTRLEDGVGAKITPKRETQTSSLVVIQSMDSLEDFKGRKRNWRNVMETQG